LGMGFGLLRGVVVVIVAIAFTRYTPLAEDTWWKESIMIDRLAVVEDWSRRTFGDEFARFLGPAEGAWEEPGESIEQEGVDPAPASR